MNNESDPQTTIYSRIFNHLLSLFHFLLAMYNSKYQIRRILIVIY